MTCNKPNCNQGHCDCPPMIDVHDKMIVWLEAALFITVLAMGLLAWRFW